LKKYHDSITEEDSKIESDENNVQREHLGDSNLPCEFMCCPQYRNPEEKGNAKTRIF
jgi:hypothetical protein